MSPNDIAIVLAIALPCAAWAGHTPTTAAKLAAALGKTPRRYFLHVEAVA